MYILNSEFPVRETVLPSMIGESVASCATEAAKANVMTPTAPRQ